MSVGGALGIVFNGTGFGIVVGLIVGIALELEQDTIVDSASAQGERGVLAIQNWPEFRIIRLTGRKRLITSCKSSNLTHFTQDCS